MKGPKDRRTAQGIKPWLRRQAIQITGMLPEDPDEAREVLGLSREIVDFMSRDGAPPELAAIEGGRRGSGRS